MRAAVLHYEETGPRNAPVIVFLHGFMGHGRSWQAIMEILAETSRCIAFDLPGHGGSLFGRIDRLNMLRTMEDTAHLILQDLDALGINRFSLYGYSMGGRIAQNIALVSPRRIDRLILESASFGIADREERRQRYLRDKDLLAKIYTPEDFRAFLADWYDLPLFRTLRGTPYHRTLIEEKLDDSVAELRKALNILSVGNHPFFAERLAGLSFPIHYFCGEKDDAYTEAARTVINRLPAMEVTVFAGASHNIHIQFPEEITRVMKTILDQERIDEY